MKFLLLKMLGLVLSVQLPAPQLPSVMLSKTVLPYSHQPASSQPLPLVLWPGTLKAEPALLVPAVADMPRPPPAPAGQRPALRARSWLCRAPAGTRA